MGLQTPPYQQRVGVTARQNMKEMFESSDNPQELRECLKSVASDDPKLTFAMLRFGWEKTLSIRRERAVSVGFVGALIFSVTLQMCVTPLEPMEAALAADDMWTDFRAIAEDLYHVLITLGATTSAISVVNSALYILWIQIYVSDADDFIWFCQKYPVSMWVDAPMVSALLFSVLAVAFASIALYAQPVASICFFSILALILMTLTMFVLGALPGERRMRQNFEGIKSKYSGYIDEAAAAMGISIAPKTLSAR